MIIGIGIDLAEVQRIEDSLRKFGSKFTDRIFTGEEKAYCEKCKRPVEHFAGRFAAKEAAMKVLRTGWAGGIGWNDVCVAVGNEGNPEILFKGMALKRAKELGINKMHISITHSYKYAVAVAVAED